MKRIKIPICLLICFLTAASLGGCALMEKITKKTEETAETRSNDTSISIDGVIEEGKTADRTLAEPEFNEDLDYSIVIVSGSEYILDGTATSTDGGSISYQWYINNVDSNGGGTALFGETDAKYGVNTSEIGVEFYYVVAANNHDDSYNMAVSEACGIEVIEEGEFTTDEFGGIRYLSENGTFPAEKKVYIDGSYYYFDETGYRITGWRQAEDSYEYYDDEGKWVPDEEFPEGYTLDEERNLVEVTKEDESQDKNESGTKAEEKTDSETKNEKSDDSGSKKTEDNKSDKTEE